MFTIYLNRFFISFFFSVVAKLFCVSVYVSAILCAKKASLVCCVPGVDVMDGIDITPHERSHVDYLTDLFAIVLSIEYVERAGRRELITQGEYEKTVERLLEQYNSIAEYLATGSNPLFTSMDSFLDTYCSRCPMARITIKQGMKSGNASSSRTAALYTLNSGYLLVTLQDCIRLNQTSADALFPVLDELLEKLSGLGLTQRDFVVRLESWRQRIRGMRAADMLDETATRDFDYDLECARNALHKYIETDPEFSKVAGKK